jgi:hypothetical protein
MSSTDGLNQAVRWIITVTMIGHAPKNRRVTLAVALLAICCALARGPAARGQEHQHPVPEKLGMVRFPVSCSSEAQKSFQRGVAAAQAYSQIAPSAPHALHMPSHIYTRLGMIARER